jgi:transposase
VHYGMGVVPARPYKPRDKAKAESGVQVCERWIVAGAAKPGSSSACRNLILCFTRWVFTSRAPGSR